MYACTFNRSFNIIGKEIIDEPNRTPPTVIHRIPSYEILIIGLNQNMAIVEFDQNINKFVKLATIDKIHTKLIYDIAIKGDKIFSIGSNEKVVKVTRFGSKTDQSIFMNPAFTSALTSTLQTSPLAETSTLPSNLPAEGIRYKQSTSSRINVNSDASFEKLALSKTARAIYVGGGSGVLMLRYNDQSQQYLYQPIDVGTV